MTSKVKAFILVIGALLGVPIMGRVADEKLADEDVLEYYGEHIQGRASGIYSERGWVFFQQRIPLDGDSMLSKQRALGRALGNVRRDVFVAVNNLAAKLPWPQGATYEMMKEWSARLGKIHTAQQVIDLPSKAMLEQVTENDYTYALAIAEDVLRKEAERVEFAGNAEEIAASWRGLCEEAAKVEDACAAVKATLARSDVKVGVDFAKKRYVFIGSSECEMDEPANDKEFIRKRRNCTLCAEVDARRKLVQARQMIVTSGNAAQVLGNESAAQISIESYYEILAKESLNGVTVLTTAESWNPTTHRYQVALALAWSEKLAAEKKGVALEERRIREEESVESEWTPWVKTQDFARCFGTRMFRDFKGVRRFVGIGFSDIEGKTGASLRAAERIAQMDARRNLALFVNFDFASKQVLASLVQSVAAREMTEAVAWEKYCSLVSEKCKEVPLQCCEIYAAPVRHPLTGHLMHVSVFGLLVE